MTRRPFGNAWTRSGDPRKTWQWRTGEVDYVAQLGLTAGDVPALLAIAREWAEPKDWPDDENYVAGYAPIHAWRGLAQLRAPEALAPLLEMMDPLDKTGDDWCLDEFPHVFGWIGPSCLAALSDYLADAQHAMYPRVAAAEGAEGAGQTSSGERARRPWGLGALTGREEDEALPGGGPSGWPAAPVEGVPVPMRPSRKVGRNEPCPCGSGKKYKRCCGR